MKIERYYSSVREEVSPLANDAFTLLETQDYIGFFKACGPNYVRSLRRAQEVTATFKFQSSSKSKAVSFSMSLKVSTPYGASGEMEAAASSSHNEATSSLTISIVGYGMGLNQEGSETMVATTLAEYQNVMRYAFRSMTVNEDAHNIGMVYGMEVVPWVNNVAFQVAAKVADENIIIPLPRSMIPKADSNGNCTVGYFQKDKYNYCCEPEQQWHPASSSYPVLSGGTCNATDCVCKPVQNLDKALVKDNMVNNGEFVARMDNAMRYKLAQIASLEKCISATKAIPKKYEQNLLKANDSVKYDKAIQYSISLLELKMAIDPLQNFGMVHQLARELDEWIQMFITPCIGALYGMNVGTTPNTDVSLFMAYPWYSHPECMMLSCITNGMRWDRDKGGCVPGMIHGAGSANYDTTAAKNTKCAKDEKQYGATQTCKYDSTALNTYHVAAETCWNNTQTITGVDYLVNHFCNPVLTNEKLADDTFTTLQTSVTNSCPVTAEVA